jgi:hypothetical protein
MWALFLVKILLINHPCVLVLIVILLFLLIALSIGFFIIVRLVIGSNNDRSIWIKHLSLPLIVAIVVIVE